MANGDRLSPEQQALRDSAIQIVDRLGPRAVGQLDDLELADKLEAAVSASGWRELREVQADGKPLASAVEVASLPSYRAPGAKRLGVLDPMRI